NDNDNDNDDDNDNNSRHRHRHSKSANSSQSQSPSSVTLTADRGDDGRSPADDNSFDNRDEDEDENEGEGEGQGDDDEDSGRVVGKPTKTMSVENSMLNRGIKGNANANNNSNANAKATKIKAQMAYKVASLDTYERTVASALMRLHQILQYSLKHSSLTEEQFAKLSDIIREYLQKKHGIEVSSKNPQLTMPIRRMSVHKDQINHFYNNNKFSSDDYMLPLDLDSNNNNDDNNNNNNNNNSNNDNNDSSTPNQSDHYPHLPKIIDTLDCNVIELGKSLAAKHKTELKAIWNAFYIQQYSAKEKTDFEIKDWIPYYDVKHFVYHLVQLHMDEQLRVESARYSPEKASGVVDIWNKEDVGETARQILKIIDIEEGGTHVNLKRTHKIDSFESKPITADQSPLRSELHGIVAYTFEQFLRLGQILKEQEEVDNEDSNEFDDFQIDFQDFSHFLSDKQDDILESISKYLSQNGLLLLIIVVVSFVYNTYTHFFEHCVLVLKYTFFLSIQSTCVWKKVRYRWKLLNKCLTKHLCLTVKSKSKTHTFLIIKKQLIIAEKCCFNCLKVLIHIAKITSLKLNFFVSCKIYPLIPVSLEWKVGK
ncbi:armadillo repeat-containing protein, partial [Reticulomyxa filosa]